MLMDQITSVLLSLITAGGLGLTNYIIAEQLGAIDSTLQGTNREKTLSAIFTAFNFILYLLLKALLELCLKGNWPSVIATIITIFLSLLISLTSSRKINKWFYHFINKVRSGAKLSNRKSETVWQDALANHGSRQRIYLYDFDHHPLGYGNRIGISNDKDSNYAVSIQPDLDDINYEQPSYDDIERTIQSSTFRDVYDVRQYVDFQQKFIAIVANEK